MTQRTAMVLGIAHLIYLSGLFYVFSKDME